MTTRGDFVTEIRSELNRKNLSAGTVTNFLGKAIEHYKGERFVFNTVLNETLALGSGTFQLSLGAFSTSLIEVDALMLIWPSSTYREELVQRPLQWVEAQRTTTNYKSQPNYFAVYGNQVVFDTYLDRSYDFEVSFLKELSALPSDAAQNAWINQAKDLIGLRTKRMIFSQYIRGEEGHREALALKPWENEAYDTLRSRLVQREATGHVLPYGPGVPRSPGRAG